MPGREDRELLRLVRAELDWEPSLSEEQIDLAVKDGVVTLSGQVESYEQKRVVEEAVKRVSGVKAMAEELHVRCPGSQECTDTEIAHAVAQHLRRQTSVPEGTVKAKVEGGWVTLEGVVELAYHKAAAERGMDRLQGVRGITNLIAVRAVASTDNVTSGARETFVRGSIARQNGAGAASARRASTEEEGAK
ncbi:MAG: BON domain-containing protein [Gemmatimonadota bacterium]|nr:MAG: BON domain-containing protein [Gemmatimonadota bacterium]